MPLGMPLGCRWDAVGMLLRRAFESEKHVGLPLGGGLLNTLRRGAHAGLLELRLATPILAHVHHVSGFIVILPMLHARHILFLFKATQRERIILKSLAKVQ